MDGAIIPGIGTTGGFIAVPKRYYHWCKLTDTVDSKSTFDVKITDRMSAIAGTEILLPN